MDDLAKQFLVRFAGGSNGRLAELHAFARSMPCHAVAVHLLTRDFGSDVGTREHTAANAKRGPCTTCVRA